MTILRAPENTKTSIFPIKSVDLRGRKVKKGAVAREIAILHFLDTLYGGRRELVAPNDAVIAGIEKKRMFLTNWRVAREITHFSACPVPQFERPPMR